MPTSLLKKQLLLGAALSMFLCIGHADCKVNAWTNYHQYHAKGKAHKLSFKLQGIDHSVVWLHCSSGHPDQKTLEKFSDNANCRVIKNTLYRNTLGLSCSYKKPVKKSNKKPCITVWLQCQ